MTHNDTKQETQNMFKRINTSCKCGDSKTIVVLTSDYNRWQQGELIQNVWPDMSPDDRERLIAGTCVVCWDESCERNEDGNDMR